MALYWENKILEGTFHVIWNEFWINHQTIENPWKSQRLHIEKISLPEENKEEYVSYEGVLIEIEGSKSR